MKNINDLIQDILDDEVSSGREYGLQFALYKDGCCIVDAYSGTTEQNGGESVTSSTLFPVFSTTKGITSTIIHRLADRGLIRYDEPVCTYWNEFAQNNKSDITIRHILTHTAGMQNMPNSMTVEDSCDSRTVAEIIASLPAASRPGERFDYHAVTFGTILGEVASRVTEKSFPEIVRSEICEIIGDENIYCGLHDDSKVVATLYEPNWNRDMITNLEYSPIPNCAVPLHEMMNSSKGRRASMPASSGIMSAKAISAHYAALMPHGAEGKRFFGSSRLEKATELYIPEIPCDEKRCLGYIFYDAEMTVIGHGGYGGSNGFADMKNNIAAGFTKNHFNGNDVWGKIIPIVFQMLK